MTYLRQNKTSMIAGTALLTIALAFGGYSFASHSFEAGVAEGTIPDNTHIRLDGITLAAATFDPESGDLVAPGGIFPLYDASPNYVAGHFLLTAPCEPVSNGDDTYRPTVSAIAGHIDEHASGTYMESIPLFYINTVNNAPDYCVFHSHIPDPLNGGAPRVTDIDLVNLTDAPITFSSGHVVDINIQSVLGNIGDNPYTDGPTLNVGPNPVFDLNDEDTTNDGWGHSSQIEE